MHRAQKLRALCDISWSGSRRVRLNGASYKFTHSKMQRCNHWYRIVTTKYRSLNPEDLTPAESGINQRLSPSIRQSIAPVTMSGTVQPSRALDVSGLTEGDAEAEIQMAEENPVASQVEEKYAYLKRLMDALIRITQAVRKKVKNDDAETYILDFPLKEGGAEYNEAYVAVHKMRSGSLSPEETLAIVEKSIERFVQVLNHKRNLSWIEAQNPEDLNRVYVERNNDPDYMSPDPYHIIRMIDRGYYVVRQLLLQSGLHVDWAWDAVSDALIAGEPTFIDTPSFADAFISRHFY
jgi:hypothetical protein